MAGGDVPSGLPVRLVQVVETGCVLELGRFDECGAGYADLMDGPVEFTLPKVQELCQDWEAWSDVEVLPDIDLDDALMVRHPVQDLGCGDAVVIQLAQKGRVNFVGHVRLPLTTVLTQDYSSALKRSN